MGNNCFKGKAEDSFESSQRNSNKQIVNSTATKQKRKKSGNVQDSLDKNPATGMVDPMKNPFKKRRGEGYVPPSKM